MYGVEGVDGVDGVEGVEGVDGVVVREVCPRMETAELTDIVEGKDSPDGPQTQVQFKLPVSSRNLSQQVPHSISFGAG